MKGLALVLFGVILSVLVLVAYTRAGENDGIQNLNSTTAPAANSGLSANNASFAEAAGHTNTTGNISSTKNKGGGGGGSSGGGNAPSLPAACHDCDKKDDVVDTNITNTTGEISNITNSTNTTMPINSTLINDTVLDNATAQTNITLTNSTFNDNATNQSIVLPKPCTDTDNGIDYFTAGTCIDSYGRSSIDSCQTTPTNIILFEYYCNSGGWCSAKNTESNETYICADGRMVPKAAGPQCTDTDEINYYIKGTCVDETGNHTDFCSYPAWVVEYYNTSIGCASVPFTAKDYVCKDGALVVGG